MPPDHGCDGETVSPPFAQIEHAIEDTQKLIELMRTKQDSNPPLPTKSANKINHNPPGGAGSRLISGSSSSRSRGEPIRA